MKKGIIILIATIALTACEAVFVENISDKYITLIAPTNNATVKEGSVNFLWESVEEASEYQLQIATPAFSNASQVVLDTVIPQTTFTYKLIAGEYEWRVRGKNSEYTTAYESSLVNITDTDISNAETELLLPEADGIRNETSQKLTWTSVTDAIEYRVQIWKPDANGALEKDIIVTETEYTYTFTEGNFVWKVRPQSETQNGKFVERKLTIDSQKPNKPENVAPENNQVQTATTIDFSWTRTDVPGTPEIDSIYVYTDVNLTQLSFKGEGANKTFKKENVAQNPYYWFVQSFDKAGNTSEKSNTFLITVN